jgi:hypothetical protein
MTTTMQEDWARVQQLVLRGVSDLEEARVLLRGRALARGLVADPAAAQDWALAEQMADFLGVVADGAWSVRAQVVAARRVLVSAEAGAFPFGPDTLMR